MTSPSDDQAALEALARGEPALVWRTQVADTDTPVAAALTLFRPGRGDFLLESVEGGAVRSAVRGREADRDAVLGQLESGVLERRAAAVESLPHAVVGQPDGGDVREAAAEVNLDLHQTRQPACHRPLVCRQPFGTRQHRGVRPDGAKPDGIDLLHGDLLQETRDRYAAESARRTIGRQRVIGTATVVAERFGCVIAEKHRPGVLDRAMAAVCDRHVRLAVRGRR